MKLQYQGFESENLLTICLCKSTHLIELHCKRRDENTYALVALSGQCSAAPEKIKTQGPYHSPMQLQAAARAIANSLLADGYKTSDRPPLWSIPAQRCVNQIKNELSSAKQDYEFDPKDVYFNTLKPSDD